MGILPGGSGGLTLSIGWFESIDPQNSFPGKSPETIYVRFVLRDPGNPGTEKLELIQ
jgi:hypothetical protein